LFCARCYVTSVRTMGRDRASQTVYALTCRVYRCHSMKPDIKMKRLRFSDCVLSCAPVRGRRTKSVGVKAMVRRWILGTNDTRGVRRSGATSAAREEVKKARRSIARGASRFYRSGSGAKPEKTRSASRSWVSLFAIGRSKSPPFKQLLSPVCRQ